MKSANQDHLAKYLQNQRITTAFHEAKRSITPARETCLPENVISQVLKNEVIPFPKLETFLHQTFQHKTSHTKPNVGGLVPYQNGASIEAITNTLYKMNVKGPSQRSASQVKSRKNNETTY